MRRMRVCGQSMQRLTQLDEIRDGRAFDDQHEQDEIRDGRVFEGESDGSQGSEPIATREKMEDALDDLESENRELRQEVQEHREEARDEVAEEKPPTPTQKLRAQVDALSIEVAALGRDKSDLQMRVDWFEAQGSAYDVDHYKRVNDQQGEIRTLQGRLNRLTNEREDARGQARFWKAEAMKLGWKESRERQQAGLTA